MDRKYKAPDKVNVYASAQAKAAGAPPLRTLSIVPHSLHGYENYVVDGVMHPGFVDGERACVFLDTSMQPITHI